MFLIKFTRLDAQTHFKETGNFTDAMNISILEAKVNGVNMEAGDEIGIFDGSLCVGLTVLDQSVDDVFDTKTKSAVAGSDDAETQENDGFTVGNPISFRFWDKSENTEMAVSEASFYNPNSGNEITPPTFQIGATAYVSLNTTFNYKPKSNAGPDQIVHEGESGQLDGTGSVDLNQDSLSYLWYDLDELDLNEPDVAAPAFTAPQVSEDTYFRMVLVVADGNSVSDPDTIVVAVLNVVTGPVANAGGDEINATENEAVILDGSKSFDPDGQAISWHWELSLNNLELYNSDSARATFIAPEVNSDTTIYAVLTVTNLSDLIDRDTIQIRVLNLNHAPIAVANSQTEILEEEPLVLDGSNSFDPDSGPFELAYHWNSLNGGEISNYDQMNAVFTAPRLLADSTFYCSLVVFDGEKYSSPDTIAVTVLHTNLPPVADAGADVVVNEGDEFTLNGTSSSDPEGKILLYEWTSEYLILDDVSSPVPIFIAPEIHRDTTVFATLNVSDDELSSETDTVWITIKQVNKNPQWINLPVDSAYLGRSYRGEIEVQDADLYDTLTISAGNLPVWLSFVDHGDGIAELFTGYVPHADSLLGDMEIVLQASDGTTTIDTTLILHLGFLTAIPESQKTVFTVFPNPVTDWLSFQFDSPLHSKTLLKLYSIDGKLVKENVVFEKRSRLFLGDLNRGFYLLELLEDDRRLNTVKILLY